MEIQFKRFSMPKEAGTFHDYQDATYPLGKDYSTPYSESIHEEEEFRCALSDGATDAVFSKCWAELLVEGYATQEWSEESISSLALARTRQRWQSKVNLLELPWYTQEKARLGAAAAVVTLKITAAGRRWSALAIGDSCLFHIRRGSVITRVPELDEKDFGSVADLICSNDTESPMDLETIKHLRTNDSWQVGDSFLLMSDALACWFVRQIEEGAQEEAIAVLDHISSQQQFEKFVSMERRRAIASGAHSLKDDDTTLILVKLKSARHVKLPRSPRQSPLVTRHNTLVSFGVDQLLERQGTRVDSLQLNDSSNSYDLSLYRLKKTAVLCILALMTATMLLGAYRAGELIGGFAKMDIIGTVYSTVGDIKKLLPGAEKKVEDKNETSGNLVKLPDPPIVGSKKEAEDSKKPAKKTTKDSTGPRPDAKKSSAKRRNS